MFLLYFLHIMTEPNKSKTEPVSQQVHYSMKVDAFVSEITSNVL